MTVENTAGSHPLPDAQSFAPLPETTTTPVPQQKPSRREKRKAKATAKAKSKHSRRSLGYWVVRGLRKAWMPLVIMAVVAVAAFSVDRLQGFFGKTETTRPGSGLADDAKPFDPKAVVYEIFGPEGTVATVNYLDLDAVPQIARDVVLPWSLTLTTTAPAAAAVIVAQGDSDSIGCRITVDGELKDERVSTGVSAQTFCIVKSG